MALKHTLASIALAFVTCSTAVAREELHVPSQYPSLYRAITAARAGDVVVLAPGRYEQRLRISKPITVRGSKEGETWILGASALNAHLTIDEHAGNVRFEHVSFGTQESGLGDTPLIGSTKCDLTLSDVRIATVGATLLDAHGGDIRLERVRVDPTLGDVLVVHGENSWVQEPCTLTLEDVRLPGQGGRFTLRAIDGARARIGAAIPVTVVTDGDPALVAGADGTPWKAVTVLEPEGPPEGYYDELYPEVDMEVAGGEADPDPMPEAGSDFAPPGDEGADPGEMDDFPSDDDFLDDPLPQPVPGRPELTPAERIARHAELARRLNTALADAPDAEADSRAMAEFFAGMWELADGFSWMPVGGDEYFAAELASFCERRGRAGFDQFSPTWPKPPMDVQGNDTNPAKPYPSVYRRIMHAPLDDVFVTEDLAGFAAALAAWRADPNRSEAAYAALAELGGRFGEYNPAMWGARAELRRALAESAPDAMWRFILAGRTRSFGSFGDLTKAVDGPLRARLFAHWRSL